MTTTENLTSNSVLAKLRRLAVTSTIRDVLTAAANQIEQLEAGWSRCSQVCAKLQGERDDWQHEATQLRLAAERAPAEPTPVDAKVAARDVHYRLIEDFGLADDPSANAAVRELLCGLARASQPPEDAEVCTYLNH